MVAGGSSTSGVLLSAGMVPTSATSTEAMSGSLLLQSPVKGTPPRRVHVQVHRTSLEHFCVLYPEKSISLCKPLGFVNLKNCTVAAVPVRNGKALQVTQANCDAQGLLFVVDKTADFKRWLDALQRQEHGQQQERRRRNLGSVSLPMVEEELDGDEQ